MKTFLSDDPESSGDIGAQLVELLRAVMITLQKRAAGSRDSQQALDNLVTKDGPRIVRAALSRPAEVVGRTGVGTQADVPWIGIFPPESDTSAQAGCYLVYLFAKDGSRCYLSLNQGTERLRGGNAPLRKRALDILTFLGDAATEDLRIDIDLRSDAQRPRRYEAGSALARCYEFESDISGADLEADLNHFWPLLQHVSESGMPLDPEIEPLHILLKWNTERRPTVIEDHKIVAEREGSVWWGRFGTGPSRISASKLEEFQLQLDRAIPTHVILHRRGEVWMTDLLEFTANREDVRGDRRNPEYYTVDDCNFFVRLSNFRQVDPEWSLNHLVLASDRDANPAKMVGALSNQANPLFVYERFEASNEDHPPKIEEGERYTVDVILAAGCFHPKELLESILRRWEDKKNLVLQGAPGTGKTWVARRLAFALIGSKSPEAVRSVQFHPNTSYEDFVRGWRPRATNSGAGVLELTNGPLIEHAERARQHPHMRHILIIEEINRGNPAQAFGEMLTLIEATKRSPEEGLTLTYSHGGERYFLPENFFILGTMNIADRSLALVDFALRRRFAFETLQPTFNTPWAEHLQHQLGIDIKLIEFIKRKVGDLNQTISDDPDLGSHFAIGHSFFTPAAQEADGWQWYRDVIETEIKPLLREYWFDNREKADESVQLMLAGAR